MLTCLDGFDLTNMTEAFYPPRHLYYKGQVQMASGPVFRSINPSTAQPLADIHAASLSDVDAAITSAQNAFPSWSKTPPVARARILLKAVQLLRDRNDEIAQTETQDTGKPFSETSTVDVVTGADVLEYFANLVAGGGLNGETIQLREDAWVYTKKEALGVCAGIGAWNYPLQMYATTNTMIYPNAETRVIEHYGSLHLAWLPVTPWCTSLVK